MTTEEALHWLQQVDGKLYRSPRRSHKDDAWVAVVRTPRAGLKRGKLIVALGETMQEATRIAAEQWQALFASEGALH